MDRKSFLVSLLAMVGLSRVKVDADPPRAAGLCGCGFPLDANGVCEMAVPTVTPARIEGRTAWSPELVWQAPLDVTMDAPCYCVAGQSCASMYHWPTRDRRKESKPLPRMLARDRRGVYVNLGDGERWKQTGPNAWEMKG